MRKEVERAVFLLQSGDANAVEQALALLQDTVFSFSMKVCGQREDAEDRRQGSKRSRCLAIRQGRT